MSRLEETREKYQNALEKLRTDEKYFTEYLKFSGRSYKIPAAHTVSIFENNPNGAIFAEYGTWQKHGNSVKFGERSSAALIENGTKLKHYFDIGQTTAEVIPFQWGIDKDITEKFLNGEAKTSGRNYRNMATYINHAAVKQISDNAENILSKFAVNETDRKAFLYSVSTMVMTMIAARCEYKSTYKYQTPDVPDLTALHMLKTKDDTIRLCDTVQKSAKALLLKMEKSIIQIINIKQEELKNGRNRNEQIDRGMEQQAPRQQGGDPDLLHEDEKQEMVFCKEAQEWFPMYTMEEKDYGTTVYKLNKEENYTYNAVFSDVTEDKNEGIGYYGRKWQEFMEKNYPDTVLSMSINSLDWEIVSQKVDKEAEELYQILDKQYRKANPRPTTFMEIAKWEKMKRLEIDHEVMEQIVLQYREE